MGYEGSGEAEVDLPAVSAVDPVRPLPEVYAAEPESTEAADPVGADLDLDVQPAPTAETLRQAAEEVAPRNVEVDPAILVQRGVPAARAEVAADPDEAGVLVTTQQAQPVAPAPDRTSPAPQPAGEPPAEPRQPTAAVAPEQDDVAAEPAKPAPAPAAEKEPPTSPAAVTKRDRPGTVAADVRSGNGSSDGSGNGAAGRKPEQPERAGGDGEVAGAGSDGPGDRGPDDPTVSGEFSESPEQRLANGIAGQWTDDVRTVSELAEAAGRELAPGVEMPHFLDALRQAYGDVILEQLSDPSGEFDEVTFAERFLSTPFFEEWLAAQGLSGGPTDRSVTEFYDALETGHLSGVMAVTRYALHEHGRILEAARGMDPDNPARVYEDPMLFARALARAYPDGPESYVRTARLYANTWDIGYATNLAIEREATRAVEAGSTEPYESIVQSLHEILPIWDYVGQAVGRPGIRERIQDHLNTIELSLRLAAAAKVDEIWGPERRGRISAAEQRWLDPANVGISSEEPLYGLELQEASARILAETRLRRAIIGVGMTEGEPTEWAAIRETVEHSAQFGAQRVCRLIQAPMEEVIAQAQALELMAVIQDNAENIFTVATEEERLRLRQIREEVEQHGRLEEAIGIYRREVAQSERDVERNRVLGLEVDEQESPTSYEYEVFIRASLAARLTRLAVLNRTAEDNEREPLRRDIDDLVYVGVLRYYEFLAQRPQDDDES